MAPDEFKETHLIALHVHGPGAIHTVDKPVKSVADLKGLKMRAPTRQVTKLIGALGAIPVGMPLPGIPDALSKGTINGAVIPWEVVPAVKVNELTKFHAEFDPAGGCLYTTTFVMTMNKAKYNSLPPDLKKIIDDMKKDYLAEFLRSYDKSTQDTRAAWKANGKVEVIAFPADEFNKATLNNAKVQAVRASWINRAKAAGMPEASARKVVEELLN
jgi:TRAP-type C4-dicarboxylate transport system substrate-binding protein